MDVAKVKYLHAATIGYAPLIFYNDDQFDFNKFLEQCKLVWKELTSDPHLPQKLVRKNPRQIECIIDMFLSAYKLIHVQCMGPM